MRFGYHSRPDFLILGAQKSGTSALYSYLSKHPSITPASKKEIYFFNKDMVYSRGFAWYHGHFPLPHELGRHALTFEATPGYLYYSKVAQRIYEYDPRIKLIAVLRDPVDRAYSHWNMYRILLKERVHVLTRYSRDADEPFRRWLSEILARDAFHEFDLAVREELDMILAGDPNPEPSYIRRGLYYEQLRRYLDRFHRDQLLVIDSRSLKHDTSSALDEVIQFLDLPRHDWKREKLPQTHVRPYQQEMTDETRSLLREFFRPHNQELYDLLGRDLGWE